ncbi:hypothetical protein LCGC14_2682770, partial [marine sediment metagenome]
MIHNGKNMLPQVKTYVNNFDSTNKFGASSINHYDVISAYSNSFTFGIEAKNYRERNSEYLLKATQEIGIDHLRTIDTDKNMFIKNLVTNPYFYTSDVPPIRFEYSDIPIGYNNLDVYYTIFGVSQRQDLKHLESNSYKGDREDTFNIMVAEKLNSYITRYFPDRELSDLPIIKSFLEDLIKFFYTEPSDLDYDPNLFMNIAYIYDEIREIADYIFTSNIDPLMFRETARIFMNNLDSLLIETPNGINLVWEESLVAHLPALDGDGNSIILKPSMLPSRSTGFFIWDEGKKKYADELIDSRGNANGFFIEKNAPYIFIHDDSGNNGIMPAYLLGNDLPDGISLGYKDSSSGEIIKGVYIC